MLFRSAIVSAIERGIQSGERHAIFEALRSLDPIIRWWARQRLYAALRFSELNTAIDSPAHQFRVAALHLFKVLPNEGYEDAAAVERHFRAIAESTAKPRRGPWLTLSLFGLGVLTLLAAVVIFRARAPFDPLQEPAGKILGPGLTEFLVATGRGEAAIITKHRNALASQATTALGAAAGDALTRAIDGVSEMVLEPRDPKEQFDRIINAVTALDVSLAKDGQPFFVDADALTGKRTQPLLLSFYIERERTIEAGDRSMRVVHLWRLDTLALRQGYLGYTHPYTPAALVLLDQVEEDLLGDVLPALPEAESMELVEFRTRHQGHAWVDRIEAATARALRRHVSALPKADQQQYLEVARLLAARRRLVREWQVTMKALGARLVVPRRLIPEADYLGELELKVPRQQLREWQSIHEELLAPRHLAAFHKLRDHYVAGVERHELQHRIDYAQGLFEVPTVLAERLNVENRLAAESGSLAGRARDELSAYLATIATTTPTPLLELTLLARHLFYERAGGPYYYAALGAFESIARKLSIATDILRRRQIRRQELADLVEQVLEQPPEALSAAARAAYTAQFELPLLEPRLLSQRDFKRWLH